MKFTHFKSLGLLAILILTLAAFAPAQDFVALQYASQNVTTTTTSKAQIVASNYAIQANVTVNTPAAKTFTAAADDIITTATAHGFETGLKGQASTSGSDLPDGLLTSTDYFVIVLSPTTFKLASSLSNALAGTAVDITDAGTGTHTFTPTSLAGATIKVQGSIDCVNFVDVANTSTSITGTGNILWNLTDQGYRCARTSVTLTAGMLNASVIYSPANTR